jgi:hypothetical protein
LDRQHQDPEEHEQKKAVLQNVTEVKQSLMLQSGRSETSLVILS